MQTQPVIIRELNEVLYGELTLINQYFLHARMLKNWGYSVVGTSIYNQSIQAMKHADDLIARIFFLEGLPNLQNLGKLLIGEDVEEALQCDPKATLNMHKIQQTAIALFEEQYDFVSRDLLEEHISCTENYIDWLEEQHNLIANIGIHNYLQSAISE